MNKSMKNYIFPNYSVCNKMCKVRALDFQFFLTQFGSIRFLQGFNYFKWLEYPLVYNNLEFESGNRYLDIGSGKSVFPLFVLVKNKCSVHVIDNQSIIKDSVSYYKNTIKKMKLNDKIKKKLMISEFYKHNKFDFPNNHFDKISCISVLEHIKDNGDTAVMQEISRLLKTRGIAVVTFPFNNGDYIEEDAPGEVGYFQRRYNIPAIKKRIIDATNLAVKKVIYFGERYVNFGKLYSQHKFSKINWFIPAFAPLLWRKCHSYHGPYRNFHETEIDKRGVGVACIILEKK